MKIIVADSGQIEARVNAWLAGQTDKLDTFRKNDAETDRYRAEFAKRERALGRKATKEETKEIDRELAALGFQEGDLYAEAGTRYFGRKITKKTHPVERQVAKSMELGLGFGLGSFTFAGSLLKGFLGAPPVRFTPEQARQFGVDPYRFAAEPMWFNGPTGESRTRDLLATGARATYEELLVHFAVTHHFVQLYRRQNSRIAALWKTCDELIRVMAAKGEDRGVVRMRFGVLEIMRHSIRKPSGLVLHYPGLRWDDGGYVYQGGKSGREVVPVYGGLLTENLVQSLARDIVAEQALWVRADGYRIATTTHDEIVAVTTDEQAEKCLSRMLRRMRTPPDWCADLPLYASGAVGQSYGDAK